MMMMTLLAVMTVVPSLAQYVGRPYGRPVAPARRSYYDNSSYRRHRAVDSYFGFRIGMDVATVNADDRYLDGGSPKAGLNVGFVAGIQAAPATPLYLETGLSYAELGYAIGLANVSRDDFNTAHTGCFFANVGVNF